jgi:hypothetical protein
LERIISHYFWWHYHLKLHINKWEIMDLLQRRKTYSIHKLKKEDIDPLQTKILITSTIQKSKFINPLQIQWIEFKGAKILHFYSTFTRHTMCANVVCVIYIITHLWVDYTLMNPCILIIWNKCKMFDAIFIVVIHPLHMNLLMVNL